MMMKNIQPVTYEVFHGQKWKKFENYAFATKDAVAPLVISELTHVVRELPIAFVKHGEEMLPVAMQGLQPGENLLISSDGRWIGHYIPAIYRGYPFALGKTEDEQTILCVDVNSGLLNKEEGEQFYLADGMPTQETLLVLKYLEQVEKDRLLTRQIVSVLQKYALITPWPIEIEEVEGKRALNGLYRVDENALNALCGESFIELRDTKALVMAYCQLLSMQNLDNLIKLSRSRIDVLSKRLENQEMLNLEFMHDETITFAGL